MAAPLPRSSKSFTENITLAIFLGYISKSHKFPQPRLCSNNCTSEVETGLRRNLVLGELCFASVVNSSLQVVVHAVGLTLCLSCRGPRGASQEAGKCRCSHSYRLISSAYSSKPGGGKGILIVWKTVGLVFFTCS